MGYEDLAGRSVVITGAARGIGRVAALRFAAAGARVAVAARSGAALEQVAQEVEAAGGTALAVEVDIADPERVQAMVASVEAAFGGIDVLVNNAALPGVPGRSQVSLVDMPLEDWDLVHGINMRGTMLCCKYALPGMLARGSGSLINVSSTAGRRGLAGRTHYCSSKAGIIGFTKALAWDLAGSGVRTNCVVPGSTATELLVAYYQRVADEEGVPYDEIARRHTADSPEQRVVECEEVAAVMMFLASDASRSLVGQSLDVSAGEWMS